MIQIYTDGACQGNGRSNSVGGFGVVVVHDGKPIQFYSKLTDSETTNNKEELKAILWAMAKYGEPGLETPEVNSDSAYAVNTLTNWMFGWARNGWTKSDHKPPENLDLIRFYYDLYNKGYRINLKKVPGHSGVFWNEVADRLATGSLTMKKAWEDYESI